MRCAEPVLAVMLNETEPLPLLVVPDVIVIQFALLTDVQGHPAPAVTATDPAVADAATLTDCEESE